MKENSKIPEIIEVCLFAGRLMLQSGAETSRVEDTMRRIAASFGLVDSHSYVTPTVIIFSVERTNSSNFLRISDRSTDLDKIAQVNSISREISGGQLSIKEAARQLKQIETTSVSFPFLVQILAAAFVSGSFTIMFQGGWPDYLPALISGGAGFAAMVLLQRVVEIKFFAEAFASFIIGLLALLFITVGVGNELDKIIIGSVMPLVPGLLITNAVRDLMAGHLVSGISKGAEAFLTAFAIGAGIAVVFAFLAV